MLDRNFWQGKKVFLTGHTGFKGAWLSLWLHTLGTEVTGYALLPPTDPSLFDLCHLDGFLTSVIGDIRDLNRLRSALVAADPDIVIHMAAQPLVLDSYQNPIETYEINVIGTVNLFEAVRSAAAKGARIKAVINVTSDKCYENKEWQWGYRENEPMGGHDPYSNSKACSELVTSSYRSTYFHPDRYAYHGVGIASARAGNVIGGGDWAADRLLPDCMRALLNGQQIKIRRPNAIRPWQHVLEPLSGYLILAEKLYADGIRFSEGWNFGPDDDDAKPVEWIVKRVCAKWSSGASYQIEQTAHFHEAHFLMLDCSKAKSGLGWTPRWKLEHAIDKVLEWTRAYQAKQDLVSVCIRQIQEYSVSGRGD